MEEVSAAVGLPFRIGNSSMEMARINLITTDTAATGMLSDPIVVSSSSDENIEGSSSNGDEVENGTLPGSDDDDEDLASVASVGADMSVDGSGSVVSDGSSVAGNCDDSFSLPSSETGTPSYEDVENNSGMLGEAAMDVLNVCMSDAEVMVPEIVEPAVQASRGGGRSVFLIDYVPLWGCVSVCGRRLEMEDAYKVLPHFCEIPLWMLIGNQVMDGLDPNSIRLPAHFFGVYDGHGGAQVADYCRQRVHQVLIERLENAVKVCIDNSSDWKKYWERVFVDCFQRVDDEVGGKASPGSMRSTNDVEMDGHSSINSTMEPVAPETVGSTAVVAVICSSHIIVANCGDSRAVLYRGKQAVPLSVDHKPNREDEYARIEAQGGKVIQWNGYRVFGVLAMSRSIGDRYLKPWIIPEPEVTIVPRTRDDECLILASDGLWDVLSNEEVCDVARKRILLWHKKNSSSMPSAGQKGEWADPAAQAAADHLSKLAIQRGSKDNITVIVIDLKAQRKFKSKT